ncbi:MAG: 23S rRNA (adenine(2503)-C(2))-methyltransferase RlmN [Candidatus Improbicoccus devescovinae]|nr:MAG: 23S rRNA (adenine(2503)-C(2))-methyltransferase RlmN [Candidatus Improbicoccus devescovinae]
MRSGHEVKKDIKSMSFGELEKDFNAIGFKKYRALQIFRWLNSGVSQFDEMTDIPIETRRKLDFEYEIVNLDIVKKTVSSDGSIKYLLRLCDAECIETVVMSYNYGLVVCISTQLGCRMNCRFCANFGSGFVRNLTAAEMISQIQVVSKDLCKRINNVTLMGIGEPFDNYENVMVFLKLITFEKGMNIGARHVTVSTCGLADKIEMFAREKMAVSLSVSLHASNNFTRSKIMPVNNRYGITELLNSCKYYISKTNHRITFEYIMIEDFNDSINDALNLGKLIKNILCHVNLIPANFVEGSGFSPSSKENINKFFNILVGMKLSVTIRRSLGVDINASCGQLRKLNLC